MPAVGWPVFALLSLILSILLLFLPEHETLAQVAPGNIPDALKLPQPPTQVAPNQAGPEAAPESPPPEPVKPKVIPPVSLTVTPQKQIYTGKEGLMIQFVFKATRPATLCLEKDPITQFAFTIARGGKGVMKQAPLVLRDTSALFHQPMKLMAMKPGQTYLYRLNMKRIHFLEGEDWSAGDYQVTAKFFLCDQESPGGTDDGADEIVVPAKNDARFMIMS